MTFPGKLNGKSRSFQVGLLPEGLVKERKIKHNCNRRQNLISAMRVLWDKRGTIWRQFGEGPLPAEQSGQRMRECIGGGEQEGREEGGFVKSRVQSSYALCFIVSFFRWLWGPSLLLLIQKFIVSLWAADSLFSCFLNISTWMSNRHFIFTY